MPHKLAKSHNALPPRIAPKPTTTTVSGMLRIGSAMLSNAGACVNAIGGLKTNCAVPDALQAALYAAIAALLPTRTSGALMFRSTRLFNMHCSQFTIWNPRTFVHKHTSSVSAHC